MSPDRLSRRVALSLVIVAPLLIFALSCAKPPAGGPAPQPAVSPTVASRQMAAEPTATAKPVDQLTADEKQKMFRPIVMINSDSFSMDQKTVRMFDVEADNHQPSSRPVKIVWRTTSGAGNLVLTIPDDNTCISKPDCPPGTGECTATAKSHQNKKEQTTCTYELTLDNHAVDPIIIVDPCCP